MINQKIKYSSMFAIALVTCFIGVSSVFAGDGTATPGVNYYDKQPSLGSDVQEQSTEELQQCLLKALDVYNGCVEGCNNMRSDDQRMAIETGIVNGRVSAPAFLVQNANVRAGECVSNCSDSYAAAVQNCKK